MKFTIPVLIQPVGDPPDVTFRLQPVFHSDPVAADPKLGRAHAKMERALRKKLRSAKNATRIDYSFCPDVDVRSLKLRLEVANRPNVVRIPLVVFENQLVSAAFPFPLHELLFEFSDPEAIEDRATEVLNWHFRQLQREFDGDVALEQLDSIQQQHRPWAAVVTVYASQDRKTATSDRPKLTFGGPSEQIRGGDELAKVGRCLDAQFPDDLPRALGVDSSVDRVTALLGTAERRPVLLVGPPRVGKTSLVTEHVYRKNEERQRSHRHVAYQHWMLSPSRLVSGMSYVGQWENRWLAILQHAHLNDKVLYIDDLLGLFEAGGDDQSSAADLLKPFIDRGEVRVVAEMTREQLRVFRERDRGLADRFHIVDVPEPDRPTSTRILVSCVRDLEQRFQVAFEFDVLPTILELTRRYERHNALPGRAASWLHDLAVKFRGQTIRRPDVLRRMSERSGLQVDFFDSHQRLEATKIREELAKSIHGQPSALEAMTDCVCIAKARLNNPHQPLASLLFLGPTGVGKTHCAKTLARYLCGDSAEPVRFDMNEFVSAESVTRLVGNFAQPEGLLTSAVRRQPFAVVLLDEVEKAHPDVYDLLLQLLGDARMTDARGRTVDFSNCVVIMTSNLGASETAGRVGFADELTSSDADAAYRKAVENHFRPEFINRIDRIVTFDRLDRGAVSSIAEQLISELIFRDGFRRRRCAVDLDLDVVKSIVDAGHDGTLGARAMRRSLESQLVRPVARCMAEISPQTPSVLNISLRDEAIHVDVVELVDAQRLPKRPHFNVAEVLRRANEAIRRMTRQCERARRPGPMAADSLGKDQIWSLEISEWLRQARLLVNDLEDQTEELDHRRSGPSLAPRQPRRTSVDVPTRHVMKEMMSAVDLCDFVHDLTYMERTDNRASGAALVSAADSLMRTLSVVGSALPRDGAITNERVLIIVRSLHDRWPATTAFSNVCRLGTLAELLPNDTPLESPTDLALLQFRNWLSDAGDWVELCHLPDHDGRERTWKVDADGKSIAPQGELDRWHLHVAEVTGPNAAILTEPAEGTHLIIDDEGRMHPVQSIVLKVNNDDPVPDIMTRLLGLHGQPARTSLFEWKPVIILKAAKGDAFFDLRTGHPMRLLTDVLPLPHEFNADHSTNDTL